MATTYTPQQLRQIDAQVAQVMGVAVSSWHEREGVTAQPVFAPTRSIADAWRCIDYMRERGHDFSLESVRDIGWICWIDSFSECGWMAQEATAPLAICLAFLAANGVEVQA